ncbi:MAG TPA: hypothetical protein VI997_02980 [Candidatus Thermoplasmatota archaeon]|nr:hypothetical protein [Candidatus Thermoplasmatota archaeon]
MPRPTWLDCVTDEAARIAADASADDDPKTLRSRLVTAVAKTWPFPTRLVFRGYVVGARTLEAPALARGADGRPAMRIVKTQRFLEVVPEGFTEAAFRALGAVLVPSTRGLMEGSVVTVAVDLADPATYHLDEPAMLADLAEMRVDVAVEP